MTTAASRSYTHPEDEAFLPDHLMHPVPCGPGTTDTPTHTY